MFSKSEVGNELREVVRGLIIFATKSEEGKFVREIVGWFVVDSHIKITEDELTEVGREEVKRVVEFRANNECSE